jgi:signal transduction histidine kinase
MASRAVYIVLSTLTVLVALRPTSVRRYDAAAIGWGLSTAALIGIVSYSRPFNYTANAVPDLAIAMLLYLFMPDRRSWRMLPGLLLSVVDVAAYVLLKEPIDRQAMISTLSAFALVIALGIVAGESMMRSRRRYWQQSAQTDALARQHLDLVNAKERLIATLTHEFRTPLNAIASSSALLGDYYDRLEPSQRQDVATRMRLSVDRLTHLFDEVLVPNGTGASNLRRNPVRVDLRQWLHEIGEEVRLLHEGCVVRVPAHGSPRRTVDPVLTRLVVTNLVSNACKFATGDAEKVLTLDFDDSALLIEMRDAGPGIPKEEQERVFEPFFRGRDSGPVEGTGMGLSIVREAVSLLHGTIALDSSPGRGAKFEVRLPWLETARV